MTLTKAVEAAREAKATLEFLSPLVKAAGVPPMSQKIGIMRGIGTSGAHKIKHCLESLAALPEKPMTEADILNIISQECWKKEPKLPQRIFKELKAADCLYVKED